MILPDVNLLLYSIDERARSHDRAKAWLESVLSGTETVAFSWHVLLAFLRLTTNPRVFEHPLRLEEAIDIVRDWLDQPPVAVVAPTHRHLSLVQDLLGPLGTAGNLVSDAHLAALAVEHGADLYSADRDFGRFPGLRLVNPLDRQAPQPQ